MKTIRLYIRWNVLHMSQATMAFDDGQSVTLKTSTVEKQMT